VDTYDALASVDRIITLSRKLGSAFKAGCIRLDSGDLDQLSRACREKLDTAGLSHIRIFASGDLDEYSIDRLVAGGAPIDGFGVGTRLVVSRDAPALEFPYKLVEYAGQGRAKLSPGKAMYPGRKRVRRFMEQGRMVRDVICLEGEESYGEELLREVMRGGVRTQHGRETLAQCRERAAQQLAALPDEVRWIHPPLSPKDQAPYRVEVSDVLQQNLARLRSEYS
jgi:nicotinate phosphoribosyltransferase